MRYDWTPLWRSTIGFDRLFNVLDEVQRTAEESFPPYNIERLDENRFQISVALAGFTPDEVALTAEQNVLTLEGRRAEKEEKTFLHRGISTRNFKRQFTLADHVEVKGARFENGLLIVELQREIPEAMKPRRIAINGAAPGKVTQIEVQGRVISQRPGPTNAARGLPRGITNASFNGGSYADDARDTTIFSTSTPFFTPARCSTIRAMSSPTQRSAWQRSEPSLLPGLPMHRRSRPALPCAHPTG